MKSHLTLIMAAASVAAAWSLPAAAQDRYVERPPVVVSPDLSAPWVMQLGHQPGRVVRQHAAATRAFAPSAAAPAQKRRIVRGRDGKLYYVSAQRAVPKPKAIQPQMDPMYLPREVEYQSDLKPGSIVIDTPNKFLYFIQGDGRARRYGVGVGKEGMTWNGTQTISNKRVWPDWRPPAEMIERERREKGRILPAFMPGGEANPLGARALYLGETLYRIHGTNAPWTIGTNNSSGCIRMRNQDVVELYEMVRVGATVVVL